MVEWNENDFYLSIIPIGDCDWYEIFKYLAISPILHDTGYKCLRYHDSFENIRQNKNDSLPVFFPNESITVDDNIKYRIVISYPLSNDENKTILTPWFDEEICYDKACRVGMENCILNHSKYTIIVKKNYSSDEYMELLNEAISFCEEHDRKYIVVKDDDYVNYNKVYEHFKGM